MYVKVCGLGTSDDLAAASDAGADAVGFVWHRSSPRHRELHEIAALVSKAPMTTVLVTVDLDSARLLQVAGKAGVSAVQPHGRHAAVAAAAARRSGLDVIRPVSMGAPIDDVAPDDLLLVDTPDDELAGGTGRSFEWSLAAELDRRFLLAGGLTPSNVHDAIAAAAPFGVDASSGLESSPGVKDPDRIRRFVEEAKRHE